MEDVQAVDRLDEEIAAYDRMRDDLERDHFGQWVVVREERLFNAYDDFQDAADAAVRNFGRGPYLIRRVGAPRVMQLPASLLYRPVTVND